MFELAAKLALSPLLVAQVLQARRNVPRLPEAAGRRSGAVGRGPLLKLLVLGDSSAAGVGVARQSQALAGPLAARLARETGSRVQWRLLAKSGLTTPQALDLVVSQPPQHADLAVVVTGVNDVVDQVSTARAVAARDALANVLRNRAGVRHVLFAPLPPMHQFPGLPRPLRWVAGADSQRHERALAEWAATRPDVSHVNWGLQLNRGVMADDGFHPGLPTYRQCTTMLARHITQSVWPKMQAA